MKIFNGKKEADKILLDLRKKLRKIKTKPGLAVISAGSDPASKLFIRNKKRAAGKIGVKVLHYKFKSKVKEKVLLEKIDKLNNNKSVDGIIVQLPLSKNLDVKKVVSQVSPKKDVDGFHKRTHFSSPLISGILTALKDSTKKPRGKKIIALVNSDFFGRVLKSSLKKEAIKINYLKNKKSPAIKTADIIITVCGCPNLIKGDMIKKGAILIDGGITVLKNKKVVGDVDKKSVANKARFLTPVPGGLGPLTVAFLLKNVYLSKMAKRTSFSS